MLYAATPSGPDAVAAIAEGRLVQMVTPKQGNRLPHGVKWAADNGAFTERGREGFSVNGYLAWLSKHSDKAQNCLFATAPDVLMDAAATWETSREVLPKIRTLGFPAALVAQDGIENIKVDWDAFDVLFLGGSTDWKLGPAAARIAQEARLRGKWVHMGRVNSRRRLRYASAFCDSADGTYLAFAPDANLPRLLSWLSELETQPSLF